jgi:hypothetical protein
MAGGSRKGRPNRVTAYSRETFRQIWEKIAPHVDTWIMRVAKKSPDKAAALALQLAEYHVPKLARTEVVGVADQPIRVLIAINQDEDSDEALFGADDTNAVVPTEPPEEEA